MIQLALQQDHVIYSQNQDIINIGYLLNPLEKIEKK
jgi:hypothetical protein